VTLHLDHDHDHDDHAGAPQDGRAVAVRRAVVLNRLTLGWNVVEAGVALVAALAAGSVGLLAFGLDSTVEVSASLILAWRLHRERREGCSQPDDQLAQRAVAVSFAALGAYVAVDAVRALAGHHEPEPTLVGVVLAALSLATMPSLARAKRRLAPTLGSRAQESEADQTSLCALMSGVLLVGLVANAALGWWWADPLAGLGIAGLAAAAAVRTWRADALDDTCCA
jgi:divalent metal cation (Fe/Co/Zn/Cd) transporter